MRQSGTIAVRVSRTGEQTNVRGLSNSPRHRIPEFSYSIVKLGYHFENNHEVIDGDYAIEAKAFICPLTFLQLVVTGSRSTSLLKSWCNRLHFVGTTKEKNIFLIHYYYFSFLLDLFCYEQQRPNRSLYQSEYALLKSEPGICSHTCIIEGWLGLLAF